MEKVKVDREDNKKQIIFSIVLGFLVVASIVSLIVIQNMNKKDLKENEKPEDPVVVIPNDEEEKKPTKHVTNLNNNPKKEEVFYKVTFLENTEEGFKILKTVKVLEKSKVSVNTLNGYNGYEYYADENLEVKFDFNSIITQDTNIYVTVKEAFAIEYVAEGDHSNPTEYSLDLGEILLSPVSTDKIFLGWYSDSEFKNEVTLLNGSVLELADSNNVITLYARVVEEIEVRYHYRKNRLTKDETYSNNIFEVADHGIENVLGFSLRANSKSIEYKIGDTFTANSDFIDLYAVYGDTKVEIVQEIITGKDEETDEVITLTEEVAEIGLDSESEDFALPTEEELLEIMEEEEIEVPTYFKKVDQETIDSFVIVENDKELILDTEVTLGEVELNKSEDYIPQVGDYVIEAKKEFDGYLIIKKDPETEEEIKEKLEEDYKPEAEEETKVEINWIIPESETEAVEA